MLSLERQEAYRRRYAGERPGWQPATHVYRDIIIDYLPSLRRVLDLGCGRGGIMELLHPQAGLAVGVDPDLISLREHRALALPRACGLAGRLPFSNDVFDLVCSSWVLEHLADPAAGFREVARVLRGGGHFVLVTPNRRHPLLAFNRALRWTGGRVVDWLYGREAEDTFPAFYRANTGQEIDGWAGEVGLRRVAFHRVGDPTYLAFNESLYRLACWWERLVPAALRVHLVGDYVLE